MSGAALVLPPFAAWLGKTFVIYSLTKHTGAKWHFLSINSLKFDIRNNVIFVKNEILKMGFLWIWASEMGFLWIMRLWKCDFCENAILKMWMLLIMWSWTCEFLDRLWIFAPVCEASFWWYGSKDITEVLGLFLARNPPTFVEKYYVDDAAAPRANCECAFYLLRG